MKELLIRSGAGLILVLAVISSIYFGHISFAVLFAVITFLSSIEYFQLSNSESPKLKYFYAFLSTLIFIISFLTSYGLADIRLIIIIIPILFIPSIMELYIKTSSTSSIAKATFGLLYTSVPFSMMNYFFVSNSSGDDNRYILLSIFILIWIFDSFAYLVGVSIGKNRLFKSISPKKSWEGFFGGLIFSFIAAYLLSLFLINISIFAALGMALIVAIAGTMGDLVESKLKRSAEVKDSGSIIPGHGGFLDRFDAILLIIPIISVFLIFVL